MEAQALETLRTRFGFAAFRAGQSEIISAVMSGRDVLAVMPTGGGKSLGFSLPALLLERPALVVSPLIALMKDQVDALTARRIPAGYVNSTVSPAEQLRRIAAFRNGALRLLYVAPERFRSERFLEALEGFRPGLFAVDEAHCISEWGHDFRPDYLRLKEAALRVGRPPVLALTATATREVREHIVRNLGLAEPAIIVEGFERDNLEFVVVRSKSRADKLELAEREARRGERGILYASTRKRVEELALALRQAGLRTGFYHAGLQDADRRAVQERFAGGELPMVVATNAFGMGIDRPDLRFVVHVDLPGSVEAYTQEAGRAGRDDLPARCVLAFQPGDARLQRFFIETSYPPEDVVRQAQALIRSAGGDVTLDEAELIPRVSLASHPRAAESALRILAEYGVIARGLDRESGRRGLRFLENRPVDHELIRSRAEREFLRLARMVEYAERAGCQRAYLVNYFANEATAAACGICAGCKTSAARPKVSESDGRTVRTLLEVLRMLSGRYGKRKLVGILAGSKAKDLLEAGLDKHPRYGCLGHLSGQFLESLLAECLAVGLARVEGGEYPVVALTRAGNEVLVGRTTPRLSCFDGLKAGRPASNEAAPAREADPELLNRLQEWRTARAARDGKPAFMILHNRTLEELAADRPGTDQELLEVRGIGPEKVTRFGKELLALLRACGSASGSASGSK